MCFSPETTRSNALRALARESIVRLSRTSTDAGPTRRISGPDLLVSGPNNIAQTMRISMGEREPSLVSLTPSGARTSRRCCESITNATLRHPSGRPQLPCRTGVVIPAVAGMRRAEPPLTTVDETTDGGPTRDSRGRWRVPTAWRHPKGASTVSMRCPRSKRLCRNTTPMPLRRPRDCGVSCPWGGFGQAHVSKFHYR